MICKTKVQNLINDLKYFFLTENSEKEATNKHLRLA